MWGWIHDQGPAALEKHLDLANNTRITRLPECLGDEMRQLVVIDLACCPFFTRLPESIGQLIHLEVLHLSNCIRLTELPASLYQLQSLKTLNLTSTGISHVPDTLGNLSALETLSLVNTGITMLPESIGKLRKLKYLRLNYCRHLQRLPTSMCQLGALETLHTEHTKSLVFPSWTVLSRHPRDIREFLWRHHTPLKMLLFGLARLHRHHKHGRHYLPLELQNMLFCRIADLYV